MKQEYVLGFLFNSDATKVKLIRKNKPEWQAGRLNGIGGKIEAGESSQDAMIREFLEEAGVATSGWTLFCMMGGTSWNCWVFSLFSDNYFNSTESMTSELLEDLEITDLLDRQDCISNLHWLIPLARNPKDIYLPVTVLYD